ncbi:MAG: response regulator [Planctomycetota bacterium]
MKQSRVLIIDDDQFVRQSLAELLQSWNLEVTQADGKENGLKQLKQNQVSLIMLDIKLGDSNGLDVLKSIRASGVNVPVMIMTGYPDEYNRNHFFDEKAIAYISKPIKPDNLKEILKMCLKEKGA